MASTTELVHCLRIAVQASRQAGVLLRRRVGRPRHIGTKRSAIDLVTEVDRAAERIIYRTLHRAFPSHAFLGEERTHAYHQAPYQWIVDPLDGTTNFIHGVPAFAVSIALAYQGRPIVGVIYDPMREELFTASRGAGARLNGRRIHVSATRRLADSLLSTGFSTSFRAHSARYLAWFKAFQMRCHAVRRMGSTALSLAYVACGREEGFYEREIWPWDAAAGMVLVEEAGGRVTNFRGAPLRLKERQIVASNGSIHDAMIRFLTRASRP